MSRDQKQPRTLKSWSISKIQVFEQCHYRAYLAWVEKVPDLQPKVAADRGSQIHLEAEFYVTGQGPMTFNLRHFETDISALRQKYAEGQVFCEEEWGFNKNWEVCDYKTAWLRLKCDVGVYLSPKHIAVIDYKTGARFGNEVKHAIQLQLYAVCTLLRHPEAEQVTCELWYLDHNELATFTMHRRQMQKYLAYFNNKGVAFTTMTDFKPNPNIVSCKYCPYHEDKQGNCKYGVVLEDPTKKTPRAPSIIAPATLTPEQEKRKAAMLARLG